MKLYLFVEHHDAYEPIHSVCAAYKRVLKDRTAAVELLMSRIHDFAAVFELDDETGDVSLIERV